MNADDPAAKLLGDIATVVGNARADHEAQFHGEPVVVVAR